MILAIRFLLCVLVAVALFIAWIYFRQDRMIYHPRPYRDDHLAMIPRDAIQLDYKISCGTQTAWYVPPRSSSIPPGQLPDRLWILSGGNGSLALFWGDVVHASPDGEAGYLMFDYPGYGHCEGEPSPDSMAESGDAALQALAAHLDTTLENVKNTRVRLLGHSLGAGVALAFAQRHNVDRVVLIAPFTSLRAMADKAVSPWLGWLLRHNFDNLTALTNLSQRAPQPRVIVTHGTLDNVIPVEMSRRMKEQLPNLVEYIEIPGANHESILDGIEAYMAAELPQPVTSLKQAKQAARSVGAAAAGETSVSQNFSP